MRKPDEGRNRVVIQNVKPELDCGRFPIKRIAGEMVVVEADVFCDGHDSVRAQLLWKREDAKAWETTAMRPLGNDRWQAEFLVDEIGRYLYTVAGEVDHFGTWRADLKKRLAARQELSIELQNGALLLDAAAMAAKGPDTVILRKKAEELRHGGQEAANIALADELAEIIERYSGLAPVTTYDRELAVTVDRERAGFSAWYELFPRSWSRVPGKHGTLRDVTERLEYVAEMGFDVLYLPPIHPVGRSFRKGKNNSVQAQPDDVGSPWAIGAKEGGHTAILPELGTFEDFARLVERARALEMEIALDIAFQCSPDHPWVKEHPEFFKHRADGSIQYAENPPKKYQDIYPLDFESSNWTGLWTELKGVFSFWIDKGVRIFRVDNPHTKAFPFWEWAITELKAEHPDVLFLAEAFTRPRVMERLAKLGFSQSYTYFAWRNTKEELTQYMKELTQTELREYFRPNFWPNTPDILTETLQHGGLAAFRSRLVLAATLAANYGIYGAAFELGEHRPAAPGSEEYLNSEKYEIKVWELDAPWSLKPLITRLNRARRENAALHNNESIHFHTVDNSNIICYSKYAMAPGEDENLLLAVVNLDYFNTQSGFVNLDLDVLSLGPDEEFVLEDLLADREYFWCGARNYVELRPQEFSAHLFRIRKRISTV
ncbi:MAG TPA: alpha-1,4-glucan--maltose-1-phosphate maltosyltransferase [Acidobacteriaceae bacterium]|nr:alpha-1,4-glucan--maltose-1-phosphate maltosyltransferase [Acidobacteriaceae bacterium]